MELRRRWGAGDEHRGREPQTTAPRRIAAPFGGADVDGSGGGDALDGFRCAEPGAGPFRAVRPVVVGGVKGDDGQQQQQRHRSVPILE